jgi:prepilin-type N-terminal cleavage/methylation domain-containing protein
MPVDFSFVISLFLDNQPEEIREMERRNMATNQKGFTLIEIIAVLVILAILSAVAVPKYLNMQQQAANNAANGALAAAASNVTIVYSNMLLNGQTPLSSDLATALSVTDYQSLGDYNATYTAGNTGTVSINITIVPVSNNVTQPNANTTKTVILVP